MTSGQVSSKIKKYFKEHWLDVPLGFAGAVILTYDRSWLIMGIKVFILGMLIAASIGRSQRQLRALLQTARELVWAVWADPAHARRRSGDEVALKACELAKKLEMPSEPPALILPPHTR